MMSVIAACCGPFDYVDQTNVIVGKVIAQSTTNRLCINFESSNHDNEGQGRGGGDGPNTASLADESWPMTSLHGHCLPHCDDP